MSDTKNDLYVNIQEINSDQDNQYILLMNNIFNYDNESIKISLDNGADINKQHKEFGAPLMFAVREKNIEALKILIDNNANCNIQHQSGFTALMIAIFLLKSESIGHETSHRADNLIYREIAKILILRGVDIEIQTDSGGTVHQIYMKMYDFYIYLPINYFFYVLFCHSFLRHKYSLFEQCHL